MEIDRQIDIALSVSMFAMQVETMTDEQTKEMLVQVFTTMQHQKNKYEYQIKQQWGIGQSPPPLQP